MFSLLQQKKWQDDLQIHNFFEFIRDLMFLGNLINLRQDRHLQEDNAQVHLLAWADFPPGHHQAGKNWAVSFMELLKAKVGQHENTETWSHKQVQGQFTLTCRLFSINPTVCSQERLGAACESWEFPLRYSLGEEISATVGCREASSPIQIFLPYLPYGTEALSC